MELLTGKPAQRLDLEASTPEETQARLQELQNYLNDGRYLTAATRPTGLFENTKEWPNNVIENHAYLIERVDVENGLIYLRNPWGSGSTPAPMTLEEFNKYYRYTTVNQSGMP